VPDVSVADRLWAHLYPPFRERLQRAKVVVEQRSGMSWALIEGYRSVERQLWLYGQGRTRPGQIVTWQRYPSWHGAGLAADLAPEREGQLWYAAPPAAWKMLLEAGKAEGLDNPVWIKGDRGHLQWSAEARRADAAAWCRHGFPENARALVREVTIFVNHRPIPDALGFVEPAQGNNPAVAYCWSRAVLEAAEYAIGPLAGDQLVVWPPGEGKARELPYRMEGQRAYVAVRTLEKLGWEVLAKIDQGVIYLTPPKARQGSSS
jgi:hypothetical protein